MKDTTVRKIEKPALAPDGDSAAADAFLSTLGARVRDARARHGMTRRSLARDSRISERYLAEMERGRGNFSIIMLKKLASAIDVPLAELVDDGPRPSAEYMLLTQRLRGLEPAELGEASAMIARRFGRLRDRFERIALIGLRGAGKSTLGALLADHLGWKFYEMSRAIEAEAGVSLNEIFEFGGQAAYRRYELRALKRLIEGRGRMVLAVGGGLVSEAATFQCLLDSCYTVWLQASARDHWDRVMRQGDFRVRENAAPSEALADMRRILDQREALYAMADARLDTSGKTLRRASRELIALVARREEAAP
jgi:XRE family transcriptional regulator, aerobic/anaerobic benzoate catabolism transcriptional regulator